MVVIRRVMAPKGPALVIVWGFVMGMALRGNLLGHVHRHRGGDLMRRRTMGQDDDKGSNDHRKDCGQHHHGAGCVPCPAMEGRLAHTLQSLVLPYPPRGDIECI